MPCQIGELTQGSTSAVSLKRADWSSIRHTTRTPDTWEIRLYLDLGGALMMKKVQGHQAEVELRRPDALLRRLSDVNRGVLPLLGLVHCASQPL